MVAARSARQEKMVNFIVRKFKAKVSKRLWIEVEKRLEGCLAAVWRD